MKRMAAAVIVVALCAANGSTSAQAKPDFSGRWTLVPDPAAQGNARYGPPNTGAINGAEVVLLQAATTLKAQCRDGQTGLLFTHTHKLDGSETTNASWHVTTFKASWDGSKLLITSRRKPGGDAIPTDAPTQVPAVLPGRGIGTSQLITLESADTMVVVSTAPTFAGVLRVTKATYKRERKQ